MVSHKIPLFQTTNQDKKLIPWPTVVFNYQLVYPCISTLFSCRYIIIHSYPRSYCSRNIYINNFIFMVKPSSTRHNVWFNLFQYLLPSSPWLFVNIPIPMFGQYSPIWVCLKISLQSTPKFEAVSSFSPSKLPFLELPHFRQRLCCRLICIFPRHPHRYLSFHLRRHPPPGASCDTSGDSCAATRFSWALSLDCSSKALSRLLPKASPWRMDFSKMDWGG